MRSIAFLAMAKFFSTHIALKSPELRSPSQTAFSILINFGLIDVFARGELFVIADGNVLHTSVTTPPPEGGWWHTPCVCDCHLLGLGWVDISQVYRTEVACGTLITQEATIKWPGKLESERFRIVFKSSCEVLLQVEGNYCVSSIILELPNRHGENSV